MAMKRRHWVILIAASAALVVAAGVWLVVYYLLPSILPVLAGGPSGARPVLVISASYPGANARDVRDSVAAPLEQQLFGVEKMVAMRSRCTNDGTCLIQLTFEHDVNLDLAQVLVQNRVALAMPQLPAEVRRQGISVMKKLPQPVLLVTVTADVDPATGLALHDEVYLSNYAMVHVKDQLARLPGVGDVTCVGPAERRVVVSLDLDKMQTLNLTAADVVHAMREQNVQVLAGKVGQPPVPPKVQVQAPPPPEQLADIVVKSKVFLKDVAQIEWSADFYSRARLDGNPAAVVAIYPMSPTSLPEMSSAVHKELASLRTAAPKGVVITASFDFTPNGPAATPEYLLIDVALPDASSGEKIRATLDEAGKLLRDVAGVQQVLTLTENPFDLGRNRPCILVRLTAAKEKVGPQIRERLEVLKEARITLRDLSPPGGTVLGAYPIDLALSGPDLNKVREWAENFHQRLVKNKKLTDARIDPDAAAQPQFSIDIDRDKCRSLGLTMSEVMDALQVSAGSCYVNDFNQFGRTWQVVVSADRKFRDMAAALEQIQVRNDKGTLMPLSQVATVQVLQGPTAQDHLDGRPMVEVTANPAAGVSVADARALCATLAEEARKELQLPEAYRLTWLHEVAAK
jgi:multidrug efflux pump subunit AcrB